MGDLGALGDCMRCRCPWGLLGGPLLPDPTPEGGTGGPDQATSVPSLMEKLQGNTDDAVHFPTESGAGGGGGGGGGGDGGSFESLSSTNRPELSLDSEEASVGLVAGATCGVVVIFVLVVVMVVMLKRRKLSGVRKRRPSNWYFNVVLKRIKSSESRVSRVNLGQ